MRSTDRCRWLVVRVLGSGLLATALGAAPASARGPFRYVESEGYKVSLDLSGQVLELSVPEQHTYESGSTEPPLLPTLKDAQTDGFISGSILAQKAKQFDDGLYAAVELAAQQGAGKLAGKTALLQAVAKGLAELGTGRGGNAEDVILGACKLGHVAVQTPAGAQRHVDAAVQAFLADPLRSQPLGFYTWSPELTAIFQQDRMLQTELKGKDGIAAVLKALQDDRKARAGYQSYITLTSGLTNPPAHAGLIEPLVTLDEGKPDMPAEGVYFFPPSRSHESDLVTKLFADRPIPPGFSLVDEMIKRIRERKIELRPNVTSGWYDFQTWAIEPLVIPERMPEAKHLKLDETYRKQLVALFKGILALTRETHVKQLEVPSGSAAPRDNQPKTIIKIAPELSAEPLVTHYQRRARGYQFVQLVLEQAFGKPALAQLQRQTASGPVEADLATELSQMQALFVDAAELTGLQLGMPGKEPEKGKEAAFASIGTPFGKWQSSLKTDPDVGQDVRMMVPIFFDRARKQTKVWVFLGWQTRPVRVAFAKAPSYSVTQAGKPVAANGLEIRFEAASHTLAYPVTAEVYVTQLLDREAFRRLCDQYKTASEILKHLR